MTVLAVLIYDHRGIGESTFVNVKGDKTTIESMARDSLALLIHVGWHRLALCGSSIGGDDLASLKLYTKADKVVDRCGSAAAPATSVPSSQAYAIAVRSQARRVGKHHELGTPDAGASTSAGRS